jgi:NAD(P)H-flavin reductase
MTPRPFQVVSRVQETHDTVTLLLAPRAGVADPALTALAGQFTMLYAVGLGEVPLSVSATGPDADGLLVHTVRAVGPVTAGICAARPGDVLGVRGPFGRGWPLGPPRWGPAPEVRPDVLAIAGGLGVAPLRPVAHWLARHRADVGEGAVLVGARTPEDLVYRAELAALAKRGDPRVEVTVDAAGPEWPGSVGVVTTLLGRVAFTPARTVAFLCGPELMMRLTARALADAGVPAAQIHLALERNMHCGLVHCGRCQLGPVLVCRDGPVVTYETVRPLLDVREL